MENKETLEEVCDNVLNYLIPDCKKEMSVIQYNNAMDALKSIADWQAKRMYSEADMRESIIKASLSNIDDLIERCDNILIQFKK
jgi:hypothetical protein